MLRAILITVSLVLFGAVMWGYTFLAGNGISREFGVSFVFGTFAAGAAVACVVDGDETSRSVSFGILAAAIATAIHLGIYIGRSPWNPDHYLGALVAFGIFFPGIYWANGDDRAKRGVPRRPLFQRASKARLRP